MFQTIQNHAVAEITEKKSKFIAYAFYIDTVEQAEKKIGEIRKTYHDARHHCYAYRVMEGKQVISKSSDDGEPSGTAGAPILTILEKNQLNNILIVVIRYFGGILLGTGGLVRAYSEATNAVLQQVEKIEKEVGYEIEVILSYSDIEKFKYFCKKNQIKIQKEEYFDTIRLVIECNEKQSDIFLQKEINSSIKLLGSTRLRKKYIEKNIEK